MGSRGSPYSQRGHIRQPSLPPWQRDSTYSPLRSDEPTRLTRAGPGLIRYRRPHIAAMHTTRCTVSDMPRLRIMGKNPLPYRLLITLSPSKGSLSPRSRRNQVLRQLCKYACMGGLTICMFNLFYAGIFLWKKGRCSPNSQTNPATELRGKLPARILSRLMSALFYLFPILRKKTLNLNSRKDIHPCPQWRIMGLYNTLWRGIVPNLVFIDSCLDRFWVWLSLSLLGYLIFQVIV